LRVKVSCESLAAGVNLSNRLPYNLGLATYELRVT
jgi:hypothetical protein